MALTKVTGQVIKNTTDVTVGVLTVTNTLAVGGTVSIGGTLTYEDVTNIDAVGLITARNGIVVGSGVTLSKDGDIFATGISTFSEGLAGDVIIDDKIVHRGDTDTAIRFPGDNQISFETGGTQHMIIGTGGAISITDTIQHIGDTNTKIRFAANDKVTVETSGTERLAIEPAGNVNISKSVNVGAAITVGALGAGTSTSTLIDKGFIELTRSSGDTYIDFKDAFAGDDFDCRIITSSANQLQFFTGGQGAALCALQTGTGKVGISTDTLPTVSKLQIHSDKLGATAGNSQELLYMLSPDISNATSYRFTNYRHTNGTSHTQSEGRLRRHVDVTDQGYFGLGDGYASIGYGSDERVRITNDGYFLLGTTSQKNLGQGNTDTGIGLNPLGRLNGSRNGAASILLNRNNSDGPIQVFYREGVQEGNISITTSAVAYNTSSSDRTLKKNFEDWTENTLDLFKSLKPQKFNFIRQEDSEDKIKGFVAQDLVDSFPEAYPKDDDGKYQFNPSGMVVYLMKAIQEQQEKIETLEAEVAALKSS